MNEAVAGLMYPSWRSLYRAAILENKSTDVARRISEAEKAVLARGRELFYNEGSGEEKEALEDALYILRAFRSASQQSAK